MGERKGQNHYYPPDFDPKKHKNLNNYHGTHALRERARKLDQGILIIRFEMPYNIWCLGCNAHIAMGVRYNAQKRKVDKYLSTPIHEFKMKCHLCDQHFIIRTDPKNMDYVILEGARRKEQRWSMAENEQIVTDEKSDIKRMSIDPMFHLEHEVNDKEKMVKQMPTLKELEQVKEAWKDDYALNAMTRHLFRTDKKALNEEKAKDQALLSKYNLDIKLVKENPSDVKLASLYKLNAINSSDELDKTEKRKLIESESIFDINKKQKTPAVSSTSSTPTTSKKVNLVDSLCKRINKSSQEAKLRSIGFGISSTEGNSSKSTPLVVVKPTTNSKPEAKSDIVEKSISENISTSLVSYNSSDDDGDD